MILKTNNTASAANCWFGLKKFSYGWSRYSSEYLSETWSEFWFECWATNNYWSKNWSRDI